MVLVLYAMAGPAFEPDCCIALPTAQIAVMGPEAAVNAVYSNKINGDRRSKRKDTTLCRKNSKNIKNQLIFIN